VKRKHGSTPTIAIPRHPRLQLLLRPVHDAPPQDTLAEGVREPAGEFVKGDEIASVFFTFEGIAVSTSQNEIEAR
jgi:hypothetical protein